MSTNNSVNVPLSGNTGTGNFVGSTSPTLITPTLGVATATSVAFSPTTSGIVGTTSADVASSGYVGQEISNSTSGVSLTTNTPTNITSISLTAGDWDVWGFVEFVATVSVVISSIEAAISTTSATFPDSSLVSQFQIPFTTSTTQVIDTPTQRININSTTTVYTVANATFTTSTLSATSSIYARRAR